MQARAAVMPERHGRWTLDTVEVAEPGPQEVLVRVVASGICQTDVHARDGFFPIPCPAVYGHEGAGVVERVGRAVTTLTPGDHVLMANPSCGACAECRAGFETYCSNASRLKQSGYRADGTSLSFRRGQAPIYGSFFQQSSFASLTIATARNTIRVPDEALSQILACRHCEVRSPLLVWPLRGQGVELFGRTAALLTVPFKLPFAQHVHQLDAGEGGLRGVERFEP